MNRKMVNFVALLSDMKFHNKEECSKELLVSKRTLQNYVNEINHDFVNIFFVKFQKNKGYMLEIKNEELFFDFMNINFYFSKDGQKLFELLSDNQIITMDELESQLFLSKKNINLLIDKINVAGEKSNIKIVKSPRKGINLFGDEYDLLMFYEEYFLNDQLIDNKELINIFNGVMKEFFLDSFSQKKLKNFIYLTLINKKNKGFQVDIPHKNKLTHTIEYKKFEQTLNKEEFSKYNFTENEIVFLSIPVLMRLSKYHKFLEEEKLEELVTEIVLEIKMNTAIELDRNTANFKKFTQHVDSLIFRNYFNYHINYNQINIVKANYPLAYKISQIIIGVIEKRIGLRISEKDTGYLTFHIATLFYDIFNDQKKQLIYFVSDYSEPIKKLFIREMKIGSNYDLKEIAVSEILSNHKEYINEIIINFSFQENEKLNKFQYTINITNIGEISVLIENINQYKQEILNAKRGSSIEKLVDENNFYVYQTENLSYLKLIEDACNKNNISQLSINKILKNEHQTSMLFNTGLSIPHLMVEEDKTKLIWINIPEGIYWKKVKVEIIAIFLISDKEDPSKIVEIYDQLIRLGERDWAVKNLSFSGNFPTFVRKLKEYEEIF